MVKDDKWRAIDSKVVRAIDNAQIIVLAAELLKEKLEKSQLDDSLRINEYLDFIVSKTEENADVIHEIRTALKEKNE